ncbi:MAG: zinc-ribbon domain-containing protein [Varibaculum cambriense]|nr:zinc-ribbon domain-containing protein [Varibaculum cambriense]
MRKKSLAETNPELAAEIHPDSDIKAEDVTAGSTKKPLWVCERGHTWRTAVGNRKWGFGCPYCSGVKVLSGFNDLATVDPELASEVSPNSPFRAEELTRGSNKEIPWVCKNGHEWVSSVRNRTRGNGCPYCSNKKTLPGYNDLATTNPKLASEVSPNSKIKATEVTAGSRKKLPWRCKKNHEWEATAYSRSNGIGCPYCSNKKTLPGYNDLATTNPELAEEISPKSKIKATEVTVSSGKRLLWKCIRGHEWKARVADRSIGIGCPYCSNRKMLPGFNDLATVNPKLANEVSPNSKTKATEVTASSGKRLSWRCSKNHEWSATVASRSNGTGCPYCSNKKILPGYNDLATTSPKLAEEISPKSRIKATEVTTGSEKKLLWKCSKNHEWEATVSSRSNGVGCPYCSSEKILPGYNDLATTNPELANEVSPNSKTKATEVTGRSNKKILWRCIEDHEWEATANNRASNDAGCPYCSNKKILPGYNDLATTNPELAEEISPKSRIKATEVTTGSGKRLLWKCIRGHEWKATVAHRSDGKDCPYCSGTKILPGYNDLATTNPELAEEISPKSRIKATGITKSSSKRVLWKCSKNHEWSATVASRSNGTGCPYCSSTKILHGYNDLSTTNPKLAEEISPKSKIKATEVMAFSGNKLLWRCIRGHEWKARVADRSSGTGCPRCAGSQAERDLAKLVKSLLPEDIKILRNDRKVIKPYELDVLVPGLNLAFEFNGTYWHSDEVITKRQPQFESSKAFDKFKETECAKQGIKLFFVREKPWTESHEKEVKRVEKIVAAALKKAA